MSEYPPQHEDPSLGSDAGVKEKAAASAQAGKQAATDVAQSAADRAKDVAAETGQQARKVLGDAQSQLTDHAREQHRNAVSNLRSLGDELSSMAGSSDQQGMASDVVGQAGSRVTSIASWLDEREPGDLVEELRRFARRRPGAFVLGALAAGVLAGRLTRGVVDVHRDDSFESNSASSGQQLSSPAASPTPAPYTPVADPAPFAPVADPAPFAPVADPAPRATFPSTVQP